MFEIQGFDNLQHILTFILVYMGSPQRMKNPHMRACLADALEALLPFHKDEPAGLNTLGGYQREKLFNEHVHRKEVFIVLFVANCFIPLCFADRKESFRCFCWYRNDRAKRPV